MTSGAQLILVSILVAFLSVACPSPGAAHSPPAGWVEVSPPTDEEVWVCANWSRDEWRVEPDDAGSNMRIQRREPKSREIVLPLQGGRLIGTNLGEFGGAIAWETTGASERTVILKGNPVAFVTSPSGVFAAEGLAHLIISRGRLLKLIRLGEKWDVKDVVDLGAAPQAVTLVGPTTLFIVTTKGVVEVDLDKMVATPLFTNERWGVLYGDSIVRLSSGAILVGMRRAVIKLSPTTIGFTERWWVPSSCPRLQRTSKVGECECANK